MKTVSASLAALFLGILLALPFAADAQQRSASTAERATPNQPPVALDAVSERPQYASIPGVESNRLIQGAGRDWRQLRNGPLTRIGGWLLVGALGAIAAFYVVKGTIKLRGSPTGRMVERFNAVERATHWTVAITFVLLALTGIVVLFGKHVILPWLGHAAFSTVTVGAKNVHNFVGPLFVFSLVVMFLVYVKDNLGKGSGRFNGLEKMWFWGGVVLLGVGVGLTGLILDFPNWNQGRELMQQANVVHAGAAILFMAAAMGHIYMGTLGVEGAYRGMREGYVDEAWAQQHHALWYEQVKRDARPGATPAAARPAAAPARVGA
jgi:formate dehydrogenase subunit gamma